MNIDYKYFSGSRDPIDIINKYRMRGFGTWLNEDEKIILTKYSAHNVYWNNLYNINISSNIFGFLSLNDKLYHPRMYNLEYYHEAFPIDWNEPYILQKESRKIESSNDFYAELANRYKIKLMFPFLNEMQTIGINGSIRKLNKWVIEGCWNIMQNSIKKEKTKSQILNANKIIIKKKTNKYFDISGVYNIQNEIKTSINGFTTETNVIIDKSVEPSITLNAVNSDLIKTDLLNTKTDLLNTKTDLLNTKENLLNTKTDLLNTKTDLLNPNNFIMDINEYGLDSHNYEFDSDEYSSDSEENY